MNEPCYYRVSVKGIVIDSDDRILLAREDNGKWELLGGGLDHGEDPKQCLRREIYEETRLTVTWISREPKYFITCKRLDKHSYLANIVYRIKLENLNFIPSDECQELRFFTAQEMSEVELFPNVVELQKILLAESHDEQITSLQRKENNG